jgi:hypothetical protein
MAFEIGVMTFGEITEDPVTGALASPGRRARDTSPIRAGVGGSPASAISTGRLGLPMALALPLGPITYHEHTVELYKINRAMFHIGFGGMPQKEHLEGIELLGTEVAPVARREVAARAS